MKKYQTVEIFITVFDVEDVLTGSGAGRYEGVSDLDPTTCQDWFVR